MERDLKLEALGRVLRREIPWRQHCHRADDIATAMRMAREFGYDLVIDHGTEAHLLASQIAAASIPVIIGPLFTSRSKVELRNRSLANPGRLAAAGVRIAITTDHPVVPIHFLIHQATLAVKEGLDPVTALRAVTIHPAQIIGCADRIGSLDRRQGRRRGDLVRRPAGRDEPGGAGLPGRTRDLPVRLRPPRGRVRRRLGGALSVSAVLRGERAAAEGQRDPVLDEFAVGLVVPAGRVASQSTEMAPEKVQARMINRQIFRCLLPSITTVNVRRFCRARSTTSPIARSQLLKLNDSLQPESTNPSNSPKQS